MLYDIPGRSGIPIARETILRLAEHPNIRAIKDAKGDFSQVSSVLSATDLIYLSGDDANTLPLLSIGASGLIGVTANIAARPYRSMIDAVNVGDLVTAAAAHRALSPLVRAVMDHIPGAVSTKYLLHKLGRISTATVRLPHVDPESVEMAAIEADLRLAREIVDLG